MKQKAVLRSFLIIISTCLILTLIPTNAFALAAPAATNCINSGGDYQIINNPNGSSSGTCIYFKTVQCTDYEAYQWVDHCIGQYLFFGSLNWWPTRIIFLCIVIFIFYKFVKFRKKN